MAKNLLDNKQPIVDENGRPTLFFIRTLQERGFLVDGKISQSDLDAALTALHSQITAETTTAIDDIKLDDLFDVDFSTPPEDGQALVYDAASETWKPSDVASGGGGGGGSTTEAPFSLPSLGAFTFLYGPGGQHSVNPNGITLTATSPSWNENALTYGVLPVPTGNWRATGRFKRHAPYTNWSMTGVILRNSTSGQSVTYGLGVDAVTGINKNTFSSDVAFDSVTGIVGGLTPSDFWLRVEVVGTTRKVFYSVDGYSWQQVYSEASSDYITPDQVGFFLNPNVGGWGNANIQSLPMHFTCLSWAVESI